MIVQKRTRNSRHFPDPGTITALEWQQAKGKNMTMYRFVSLAGRIETHLNPQLLEDLNGDAAEHAGEYSVNLWFTSDGGPPVQQRNQLRLTRSRKVTRPQGAGNSPIWLEESVNAEPVSFQLQAVLHVDGLLEKNGPADELVYQLSSSPPEILQDAESIIQPGSPFDLQGLTAYMQLSAWFFQKSVRLLHLDQSKQFSVTEFPIGPLFTVTIPEETLSYQLIQGLGTAGRNTALRS